MIYQLSYTRRPGRKGWEVLALRVLYWANVSETLLTWVEPAHLGCPG